MALVPRSTKDAQVLVGSVDCSGILDVVSVKETAGLVPFTSVGSTYPTQYDSGERLAEITMGGIFGGDAYAGLANIAGTGIVTAKFDTDAVSKRAYIFRSAIVSSSEIGMAATDLGRIAPTLSVSGIYDWGYIVAPLTARTDSGNTDAADADMEAAAGATTHNRAVLHITAITLGGYANCLVVLRDGDATTYAPHTSFTAATAIGSESKEIHGSVQRYLSVSWLWQGGSPSGGHSITFSVMYSRNTTT